MATAVKRKRRPRWPGTTAEMMWLHMKRAFGGEKGARAFFFRETTRDWGDNIYDGLLMLQEKQDAGRTT